MADDKTPAGPISLEGYTPQQIADLAAMAHVIGRNPETSREFQRLAKKAVPGAHFPELELEDRIAAATGASAEKVAALEAKLQEREARDRLQSHRMAPVRAGLIREDEVEGLETYMKDKGFTVTQYEQAARFRQMEQQLAVPTAPESLAPAGFSPEKLKLLRQNPEAFLQQEGAAAVAESRARLAAVH